MSTKCENVEVPRASRLSMANSAWARIAVVTLGIVIGQAVLYGPALIGSRFLLPLRMLASPGNYLPVTDETKELVAHNVTLGDLVFFIEPERQFANSELKAGRLPLWTPHRFAGAPLYTLGLTPPWILAYLTASPTILAWTQLLVALTAGLGMYYFCRRVLELSPWPSVIAAWCYPLTGAYILWVGQWIPAVMCWLPWALAAVDRTVRRPLGWGGPALCVVTTFALIGGAVDVAGQVLLASGIFAVWRILEEYGSRLLSRRGLRATAALAVGWILGLACAAWLLLPLGEYLGNGSRVMNRSAGTEERPPVGAAAIPQIALPDMYGSSERGSFRIGTMVLPESSAVAYVGSVACLVLAPLAWFSRRRRRTAALLAFLVLFSLSWTFNIPLLVSLLRLPLINMMSHNRMAFVASFALTALAAIGFEALLRKEVTRRKWFGIPGVIMLALFFFCVYRAFVLPEPIATQLSAFIERAPIRDIDEPWEVAQIQQSFRMAYGANALFCALGIAAWGVLWFGSGIRRRWFTPALTALLLVELMYFGYDHAAQSDPALYFPRIPILDRIADNTEGRIIGFNCLPANLAQSAGLADVRGYDGVDPSRITQLLLAARNPKGLSPSYAVTQLISPLMFSDKETGTPRVPPILDMLNVRYILFRGTPPAGVDPIYQDEDYWVLQNERALPRAYVPHHTQVISDGQVRLETLSGNAFDPREVAYLEQTVDLPLNIDGTVDFLEDSPQSVTLSANMQTAGLVVLADRWDPGWKAYVNDTAVPIWRVNHALRGIRVDSGESMIRFEYEPDSLYRGLAISAAGGVSWLIWIASVAIVRVRYPEPASPNNDEAPRPVPTTSNTEPAVMRRRKETRKKERR